MQGTQYATKRSILCRGAFCGPTVPVFNFNLGLNLPLYQYSYLGQISLNSEIFGKGKITLSFIDIGKSCLSR